MAVEIQLGESDIKVGKIQPQLVAITGKSILGADYDVVADGQRFIIRTADNQEQPVSLIANWTADLAKK